MSESDKDLQAADSQSAENITEYDQIIEAAIDCFADTWEEILTDESFPTDGYLSVKNTRIIVLKDDPEFSYDGCEQAYEKYFKGAKYVVEFYFYTDYSGSAPYYSYPAIHDAVLVYEDGSCETVTRPFDSYRASTYSTDFSGFMEECVDLGDAYNQEFDFVP